MNYKFDINSMSFMHFWRLKLQRKISLKQIRKLVDDYAPKKSLKNLDVSLHSTSSSC